MEKQFVKMSAVDGPVGKPARTGAGTYNGHKNWAHWNVSLWISNDEGLYRMALDCVRRAGNKDQAAAMFLESVGGKTPDGATYNKTNVKAALRGLE